jgi:formate dehydrogenase major subunit
MTDKIKFTLDGKTVEAEAGMTIWEVANGRGLVIPHLCHKPAPGYRPDGNCRACMVEIKDERTLAASCIREPAEGMVVTTNSARAVSARKMVVEMLMTDQPARDASHDKSSHLWDMADANGIDQSRFPKLEKGRHECELGRMYSMRALRAGVPRGAGERCDRHGGSGAGRIPDL